MKKQNFIHPKYLAQKLHHMMRGANEDPESEETEENETVPGDVKKGQFVIIATQNEGEKPVRFVVGLGILKHPDFLRLLNRAEEEFGFQQTGVLAVPCPPDEVERILVKYK